MVKWMWLFRYAAICSVLVLAFASVGCVSPETQKKIDSLSDQIQQIVEQHKAGELTTEEATAQIKPLLEKMKEVRDAEGTWWEKAGYIIGTLVGVFVFGKAKPVLAGGLGRLTGKTE